MIPLELKYSISKRISENYVFSLTYQHTEDHLKKSMDTKLVETFFAETIEVFHFLEELYGYQQRNQEMNYPDEWRDTTAVVTYVGERIGTKVVWAFVDGVIDVDFVELVKAEVWGSMSSCV